MKAQIQQFYTSTDTTFRRISEETERTLLEE